MRVSETSIMRLEKRNGNVVNVNMDSVKQYLDRLVSIEPKLAHVSVQKVLGSVGDAWGEFMHSSDIPALVSEVCAGMTTEHHHYAKLAGRVAMSALHKETSDSFRDTVATLANILSPGFVNRVHQHDFQDIVEYSRDFQYDIFAFKTLERSYLLRVDNKIVERPQHMLMRVSIATAMGREDKPFMDIVRENYEAMSKMFYTHATPTLFHAGMKQQQLASCYLMTMKSDSVSGIYDTLKDCALISKGAGGIGVSISQIRPAGSSIAGTNGVSNGLTPMLKVFNDTARYIDQGGGKRKGSFAMWLEPWHPDVFEFLDLKKNHGDENRRARDLFYGLWIPDLFMKRVKANGSWSMFCPHKCPGLQDTYAAEFDALYMRYEAEGKAHATVSARELWLAVCDSQIETGTPYLMYKDAVNAKNNQSNLGTIRGSNLCNEICEYTSPEEVAVCTLASLSLPKCMAGKRFEHSRLERITRLAVRNLNSVIDINYYPIPEAEYSNKRNRPIGIGIQGLGDIFQTMELPYDSTEAIQLNAAIFETMYYAAVSESVAIAKEVGPYDTFVGSPASRGIFQFNMWGVEPSKRYDWSALRTNMIKHGLRNSLLIAPMPTASTAQIMGNTESFEPRTTNLYTRRVLAGEYMVVNPILQDRLVSMGMWNDTTKDQLIAHRGSVQQMDIPDVMKAVFKTVWELSQKALIAQSAARGPFICQSQSLNLYLASPTRAKLSSMGFYAWEKGLKTGQYYLRSQPEARAVQFTVNKAVTMEVEEEECIMCSA